MQSNLSESKQRRQNYRNRKSQISRIAGHDRYVKHQVIEKYAELQLSHLELLFHGLSCSDDNGGYFTVNDVEGLSCYSAYFVVVELKGLLDNGYLDYYEPKRAYKANKYTLSNKSHLAIKYYNRIMINGLETGNFRYMA